MDPGVGAVVYGAELTRLAADVCGAELALTWPRVGAVDLSAELGAKIYGGELLPLSAFSRHELLSQFAEMQERASH
jgi:hypothetical protein